MPGPCHSAAPGLEQRGQGQAAQRYCQRMYPFTNEALCAAKFVPLCCAEPQGDAIHRAAVRLGSDCAGSGLTYDTVFLKIFLAMIDANKDTSLLQDSR